MRILDKLKRVNPEPMPEAHTTKAIDDEQCLVNDFDREIPFWSYTFRSYEFSEEFSCLKNKVEEMARDLFNDLSDEHIDDVIENLIADAVKKELFLLKAQQTKHKTVISDYAQQRISSEHGYRKRLAELESEHAELMREYKQLTKRNEDNKWRCQCE